MQTEIQLRQTVKIPAASHCRVQLLAEPEALYSQPVIEAPDSCANFWRSVIARDPRHNAEVETFAVIALNRKNRVIAWQAVTVGTATATLVHPREVFRLAVAVGASAVIVMHNHPSGDPAPSAADIRVTRQLREAGKVLEIDVLDHVIAGAPSADPVGLGRYSFREAGVL